MMIGFLKSRLRVLQLAAAILCFSADRVPAVELYRVGGSDGTEWGDIGQLNGLSTASTTPER